MSGRIIIDVRTPEKWIARHFWAWRGRRTFGVIAAFCPTMWSFGIEILAGYGKGAALIVGPFWIGFATATSAASIPDTTQDGRA